MNLAPATRRASGRVRFGPPGGRAPRLRASRQRSLALVPNSLALIATKVATLGLGFLFWLVAARLFAPAQVGLAGGVVAAVLLCVQLALLGVGSAVIAMYPRHREAPARLLDTALTTATLAGAAVGIAFAALAAGVLTELGVVAARPGYLALFIAMSALGTVGVVLDQISTTLRRGDQALGRGLLNGGLSLLAVGALALVPGAGSMALFACWVLGVGAACALGAGQLRRAVERYRYRPRLERSLARRLIAVGLPNHALTLADRAPGLVLPVLVTELLSPAENAYWYTAWMMAWVVLNIPMQVGMTLFAEASHRPPAIDALVRHAVRWSLGIGVAAAAAAALVGGFVLSLLGARYAHAGSGPLRLLVIGLVPMTFVQAYYARCRAFARLREAVATAAIGGTIAVTAAIVAGVASGLTAMALAWLAAQLLAGGWAAWRLRVMSRARADGPGRSEPAAPAGERLRGAATAAAATTAQLRAQLTTLVRARTRARAAAAAVRLGASAGVVDHAAEANGHRSDAPPRLPAATNGHAPGATRGPAAATNGRGPDATPVPAPAATRRRAVAAGGGNGARPLTPLAPAGGAVAALARLRARLARAAVALADVVGAPAGAARLRAALAGAPNVAAAGGVRLRAVIAGAGDVAAGAIAGAGDVAAAGAARLRAAIAATGQVAAATIAAAAHVAGAGAAGLRAAVAAAGEAAAAAIAGAGHVAAAGGARVRAAVAAAGDAAAAAIAGAGHVAAVGGARLRAAAAAAGEAVVDVAGSQRLREAPARAREAATKTALGSIVAVAVALVLWTVSVRGIDLRAMTSLGMVSILPPAAFVALALLGTSFCLTLWRRREPSAALVVLHVAALVFMLYGLPALAEPQARFAVTWRHVGVMQSILDSGHVDPAASAYFNWPGFFVLAGLLLRAAGLHDVLGVANWSPLAFQLLYLGPMLLILRALTRDMRLVWLGVWVFYVGDWIGQDYFSPQAFAFLLYLVLLGVLLTWVRPGEYNAPARSATRAGLVGIVLLVFAAMVPSHQLTPFAVLASVGLLVLGRRCSARGLPLAMAVILGAWLSYMTVGYLSGHAEELFAQIGNLDATVTQNVSGRLRGDAGHLFVTRTRLVLTLGLWAVALVGAWSLRRFGHRDLAPLMLFIAPFGLVPLQPYGGEILLRVFLFSLPFTAFFVAAVLQRAPLAVAVPVTLALLGGFMVNRYGNERMDWFSADEVRVVDRLDALAPAGSTLVSWSNSLPWQARHYSQHRYRYVVSNAEWAPVARLRPGAPAQVAAVARILRWAGGRSPYLVLTRSQEAEVDLTGLGPRGSLHRVDAALRRSPAFRLVYANRDGSIYTLARSPRRTP